MKSLVKLDLHKKSVSEKVSFGRNIVIEMSANTAIFATPFPDLADVTTAIDDMEAAAIAALDGGKSLTATKDAREDEFDTIVTALANYVDGIAQGDELIVLASGMEVKRTPSPVGIPAQVTELEANIGVLSGEIALRWKRVHGAAVYLVYQSLTGGVADYVLRGESTKAKFVASGLDSGKRYWYKVTAIGAAGAGPDSDVSTSLAY